MTREARRTYRINRVDLENINFVFGQMADRIDELEGRRGTPKFKSDVNMGMNKVSSMRSGSASTDGATVVQVDAVATEVDGVSGATAGTQNLSASATPAANRLVMSPAGSQYIATGWTTPMVQDVVTGSRAFGTDYQNTTGRPMYVAVQGDNTIATTYMLALTDSATTPTTEVARVTINYLYSSPTMIYFLVLPGNYYRVNRGTANVALQTWVEWY